MLLEAPPTKVAQVAKALPGWRYSAETKPTAPKSAVRRSVRGWRRQRVSPSALRSLAYPRRVLESSYLLQRLQFVQRTLRCAGLSSQSLHVNAGWLADHLRTTEDLLRLQLRRGTVLATLEA